MSRPEPPGPVASPIGPIDGEGVYEPDKVAIGQRIEAAREAAGYANASEFARLIGTAPNTVYRYERGEQLVKTQYLVRIAEVTGRSMATGRAASEDELAWIERVDLEGMEPSMPFFDLLLSARRHGLSASEAIRATAAGLAASRDQ